jgi:RNA ligase (TIGR02306 family)
MCECEQVENMRKLVTVREVRRIDEIEGADRIELAFIDGWSCIVKKGEFEVGNYGMFFEIDSFLPASDERFSFLKDKKTFEGEEGYRLKTMRMKGVLSQGLLLPIRDFRDVIETYFDHEGDDRIDFSINYAEKLGVRKWEKPIPVQLRGQVKGNFPPFLRKTDQERIQNIDEGILAKYTLDDFEITEKLDGTSATFFVKDGVFGVCSRNLELKEDENNLYWKIAREKKIEEVMKEVVETCGREIAFQGEIAGIGVQGNPLKLEKVDFFLFDVWDITEQRYWTHEERQAMYLSGEFKLNNSLPSHIPILQYPDPEHGRILCSTIYDIDRVERDHLIEKVNGLMSQKNDSCLAEGIVFKHLKNSGFSFKVISNDYLVKTDG